MDHAGTSQAPGMTGIPAQPNGWVDNGTPIRAAHNQARCPNCGSRDYRETLSREECTSCGLVCDYWGGGTNTVYDAYLAARDADNPDSTRVEESESHDQD